MDDAVDVVSKYSPPSFELGFDQASLSISVGLAMDESAALEALANILNRLADDPYDITLHIEHVRIAQQTGMDDQVDSALEMAITFWTVGDYVWELLLERKLQGSDLESPEALQAILDLFNRAEQDYLCAWVTWYSK